MVVKKKIEHIPGQVPGLIYFYKCSVVRGVHNNIPIINLILMVAGIKVDSTLDMWHQFTII